MMVCQHSVHPAMFSNIVLSCLFFLWASLTSATWWACRLYPFLSAWMPHFCLLLEWFTSSLCLNCPWWEGPCPPPLTPSSSEILQYLVLSPPVRVHTPGWIWHRRGLFLQLRSFSFRVFLHLSVPLTQWSKAWHMPKIELSSGDTETTKYDLSSKKVLSSWKAR